MCTLHSRFCLAWIHLWGHDLISIRWSMWRHSSYNEIKRRRYFDTSFSPYISYNVSKLILSPYLSFLIVFCPRHLELDLKCKIWSAIYSPTILPLSDLKHTQNYHQPLHDVPSLTRLLCTQLFGGDVPLQRRHNGHDGVSNHQPHDCLLNRFVSEFIGDRWIPHTKVR